MLPPTIPIFPLPNVVLFPSVFLPLHIFEPRYREMVGEALAGDRIIGMALLRPGWEGDYEGRPPIYPVGCAGFITFSEQHSDGRDHPRSPRIAQSAGRSGGGSKRWWCRNRRVEVVSTRRSRQPWPTKTS